MINLNLLKKRGISDAFVFQWGKMAHYGGYYNDTHTLAGHTMYVPLAKFPEKGTPRKWSRDGKSSTTNLTITRTTTESSNNDSGQTNSSNVSSTRSSSGGSSSSSSSSGGRRTTRRN